jgi:hypothetical protein
LTKVFVGNTACSWDFPRLQRSAEMGYGFSQACLAGRSLGDERFMLAQAAALQLERDGLDKTHCYRDGEGVEVNFGQGD